MRTRGKLPAGWQYACLRDLLDSLETGKRPPGGIAGITQGVPSLSAEHMDDLGRFKLGTLRFVPREFYQQMLRGHIHTDDVLIVKDGATTGKTVFVDESFPFKEAVVNEHVFLCRPNVGLVDPKYLFFWLWGPHGQYAIRANYQGAAIGGINSRFVDSIFLPLPPLDEQQRISAILTEKVAAIDQAHAAAQAQLEAAQALPAAYLRAIFNSPEAEKWPKRRLGEVGQLLPAKSIALAGDTEVVTITTACLTEAGFDSSGVKPGRMWKQDAEACVVSKGEVLVARSNTTELVGRASTFEGVPQGAVASDLTIRIWPSTDYYRPAFLSSYLSHLYLTGYWRERASGASQSMKKITRRHIQDIDVPTPTLEQQEHIVARLNQKMTDTIRLRAGLQEQLDTINALPASLLRQAFNGEL